ncbi:MAG: hypothetical protein SFY95_04460 [Planctomycetota bacterium]|nr:hypothetical protein [Planctomycetota bacterium]
MLGPFWHLRWWMGVSVSLALAAGAVYLIARPPDSRVQRALGRDIAARLARTALAETQRFPPDPALPILSLAPVPGKNLSPATLAGLREAILSDASYVWDDAKPCVFTDDVRITLLDERRNPIAQIVLCFSCNEWSISVGERQLLEDFDPVAGLLNQVAAEAFPGERFPPDRVPR